MLTWPPPYIPQLPGRGLPVQVRDSSTDQLVVAAAGTDATLYVCGITPYDATHLGHAATYVAFDILGRAWRDAGHRVRYASNVTDVDDPLLERAASLGIDWRDLAAEQTAALRRGHDGAGRHPARRLLRRGRGHPRGRRGRRGAARRRRRLPRAARPTRCADDGLGDVYADLTADIDFGAVAGLDDDTMRTPVRRARGRPRAAPASAHRSTRCCGAASGRASPPGTAARSAAVVRAGTSSARSSPGTRSGCPSTSRAAGRTCSSRTTR